MTTDINIPWGPTGEVVYDRTYSRTKADGTKETWPETVDRVIRGNLELVYGPEDTWNTAVVAEAAELRAMMLGFKVIPAGRHLWASGVKGRQFLFNCHVSPWPGKLSEHFSWVFMRLMEGGGVGTNFSSRFTAKYGAPRRQLTVHVVCDPTHPDYQSMSDAGLLSAVFSHEWDGALVVEDSREGWAAGLTELIDTYMTDDDVKHTDRVFDVSNVRPAGARLKGFGGTASGPKPFAEMLLNVSSILNADAEEWEGAPNACPMVLMDIEHEVAACVVSGGVRRSARMSILDWNDPSIEEFIKCKTDPAKHWTTNISVAVDTEFIDALNDASHDWHRHATMVHTLVAAGMLANGEPGYWNHSLSQRGELSEVVCTNPCGEITLTEREPCVIGSVNLQAFVDDAGNVDIAGLHRAHELMTRFLTRATFGDVTDPGQRAVLDRNRRIGVGHMGVQGFLNKRGIRWSEAAYHPDFRHELGDLYQTVRREADRYAFELRIPAPIKVTTVAPTGSIAKLPGVTEGIHPVYAKWFIRRVRFSMVDPDQAHKVQEFIDQGYHAEPDQYAANTWVVEFPTEDPLVASVANPDDVESADEIDLVDMLAFLRMYTEFYADNAVSFTANIQPGRYSTSQIAEIVGRFLPDLKGVTLMPDESRPQAPYQRITRDEYYAAAARTVDDSYDELCASGACPIK